MKRTTILTISLISAWILWSGHYTGLLLTMGALSVMFVLIIVHRMEILEDHQDIASVSLSLFTYIPWLLWAIVKANIDISLRILSPKMPISPSLIRLRASQKTEWARALYANSITLTPGTVTLHLGNDELIVHALTNECAVELHKGDMDRRAVDVVNSK